MIKEFSVIINKTRYDVASAGEVFNVCNECALIDICDSYTAIGTMCQELLDFDQHFVEHKDEV